ncbi:type I-E CRISPR-associated protein Cse2/CasB [Streptomyces sp. NPDC093586]|uniref:type I-E CRISPR-associated protein Cse2/CasB n=1 Tax=Streptomyces sp. NPDC093586 TaxID=3366042 RepID=UPI00381B6946
MNQPADPKEIPVTTQAPPTAAVPAPRSGEEPTRLDRYRAFTRAVLAKCEGDPGARSALRSGVRKDLDSVPRMHQVIAHLVPQDVSEDTQRAYYAVAAMIAEQARRGGDATDVDETTAGQEAAQAAKAAETAETAAAAQEAERERKYGSSLGTAFALAVVRSPGHERKMRRGTAESRLNLLCKQGLPGLHRHLPASVRYLRSLDVPVDWARLLQDLVDWRRHSGRVARRWLQDFYRRLHEEERRLRDQADAEEPPTGTDA